MLKVFEAASATWMFDFDPNSGTGVPALDNAFGIQTASNSLWFHSGPGPTDWIKIGSGSGGGPSLQVFRYTVTGTESDLSEITITLPSPMPSTAYNVMAACQGCTNIVGLDVPIASFTTTSFLVVATGNLTAGDVLAFIVASLT